ncbi:MAG: hypothetical protein K9J12_12450 [Melioribacteraceae bacterium]|nr:hypothetical protein [Melioribacteraceae bacterium]MCF8265840.1 hypothetical protein [Melioribacteraceae bacterium]MCF8414536.1 hypothetical protein [Melioribacteraceae bacterium]
MSDSKNNVELRQKQFIDKLEDYQKETGKSWADIASAIGHTSSSKLSQWRSFSYPSPTGSDKITTEVERFLKIENKKHLSPRIDLDYVEIENNIRVFKTLETAQADKIIACITGDTGTSKTSSIQKYIEENDVIYLQSNRSYKFPIEYMRVLHKHPRVGNSGAGTLNQIVQDITSELKGSNTLLIVDQCDYLNLTGIDIFRTLNDEAKIGICFVGLPSFLSKIRGTEPEVRQVRDRIKLRIELKSYSEEDCQKILDHNWHGLNGEVSTFFKYSFGSIRILSGLVYNTRRLMKVPQNANVEIKKLIPVAASMLETRS